MKPIFALGALILAATPLIAQSDAPFEIVESGK